MNNPELMRLLPCPFCGDDNFSSMDMMFMHADGPTKGKRVVCRTCGAQAPDTAWNTRTLLSALPEQKGEAVDRGAEWLPEEVFNWVASRSHKRDDGYYLFINTSDLRRELAPIIARLAATRPAPPAPGKVVVDRSMLELVAAQITIGLYNINPPQLANPLVALRIALEAVQSALSAKEGE